MRRWLPLTLVTLALLTGCKQAEEPELTGGEPGLVGTGAGVAGAGQVTPSTGAQSTPAASAPAGGAAAAASSATVVGASTAPIPAGQPQLLRLGVPIASWQAEFDRIAAARYRLVHFDGYEVSGQTYVNVTFRPADGVAWKARHNLTASGYQSAFDQYKAEGYRLADVSSYLVGGQVRYAAMWRKATGPAWIAYHGVSQTTHQSKIDALTSQGYHPVVISVVTVGDIPQWTALVLCAEGVSCPGRGLHDRRLSRDNAPICAREGTVSGIA